MSSLLLQSFQAKPARAVPMVNVPQGAMANVRRCGARLFLAMAVAAGAPFSALAQVTYPFSNNDPSLHNTWDSGNNWATALTKPVDVSGVPTTGMVLRQISLDLGTATGSNVSTLAARLTDPDGNTVDLFPAGYFFNTDFSRYVNITFRDHPMLKRLSDFTNSYLGMPYSFGYYRVQTGDSYQNFNTTNAVNGTWTFSLIENTGVEIQFNSVTLVFGPPFTYVDITAGNANSQCDQAQCVQSGAGEITLATNENYPQNQPNFPNLTVNGCNWNAEPNNTAWFRFTASASSVNVSVSGFTNNPQQTIVLRNTGTCQAPSYSMVGCPTSMFAGGCNSTTGNPTLYHRVCYDGGTKFNHGYSLSGLTVGDEYVLIVDGQSGANSTFYIEITSGADNGCALLPVAPEITDVQVQDPGCAGDDGSIAVVATGTDPLEYSIDGGQTFQSDPLFAGLSAGTYAIVVRDPDGLTAETTVSLVAPVLPVINDISTTAPACGIDDGIIVIDASGTDPLQYSIDNGVTFQAGNAFQGLAAGTYSVVVDSEGCLISQEVILTAADAPVIDQIQTTAPQCAGDANGSVTVEATGTGTLEYSIDGGVNFQPSGAFIDLPAGVYTVVVRDPVGCTAVQAITLTEPAPIVLTSVEVSDESCAGSCDGSLLVDAQGVDLYSINGGAAQASNLFTDLCPGTYTVSVSNAGGCTVQDQVVLAPGTLVQAGFTADPTVVDMPGTPVEFTNTSQGATDYNWDFGGYGSFTGESPSFIFPIEDGTAEVCLVATSDNGCSDTVCVIIRFETPSSEVEVPTVFSPNGDGVNDTFGIIGDPGTPRSFSLQVYNRWGQLLFNGERKFQVWDGRQFGGEVVSDGTYYWVLDYTTEDGQRIERTGHVTLLR
jgi:gliding motility-associated-like protein